MVAEIDRDLGAHPPIGMGHRLERGHRRHLRQAVAPEGPARGGQDQALDALAGLAAQRLEDRVVLGIDRQKQGAAAFDLGHQQRAGADQAFLGGERHHRAPAHRSEGRAEAGGADDRRHDPLGRAAGRLAQTVAARGDRNVAAGERLLEPQVARGVADHRQPCAVSPRRGGQPLGIAVRGQRLDPITLRRARDQIEGAAADRARGAQNRHATPRQGCQGYCHGRLSGPAIRLTRASAGAANSRPSTRSKTPPWPGISVPLSLTPARRLNAEFGEVAELRDHRQQRPETGCLEQASGAEQPRGQGAAQGRAQHAAAQSRPGLARADGRREARATEAAPGEIGRRVGRPDHDQQPEEQTEADLRDRAEPDQGQGGQAEVADAETGPQRRSTGRPGHQPGEERAAQQTAQRGLRAARGDQQSRAHAHRERRATRDPAAPPIEAQAGEPAPFQGHQDHRELDEAGEAPAAEHDHRQSDRQQRQCRDNAQPDRRVALSHSRPRSAARAGGTPRSPRPDAHGRTPASGPAGTPARYRPSARA